MATTALPTTTTTWGVAQMERHTADGIVIGWVQQKLGGEEKVAEIEAALQSQLDEQRTPTTAAGVPWS